MNWKPIETAPKDGRLILAWWRPMNSPRMARWYGDQWIFGSWIMTGAAIPCMDLAWNNNHTHWTEIEAPAMEGSA